MDRVNQYLDIMNRYQNGEFGSEHLSVYEILEKAGTPDLLDRMNIYELQYLANRSHGMIRDLFCRLIRQKAITLSI